MAVYTTSCCWLRDIRYSSYFVICFYLAMAKPVLANSRRIMETSIEKARFQVRRATADRETMTLQKRRNMANRVTCCTQNILYRYNNNNTTV